MKKITSEITLNYRYDASHPLCHYTLDGVHYMNGGDFAEILDKSARGLEPVKDANTPFDVDSDIPELSISVKSQRCGLTDRRLADNLADYVRIFFDKVHSKFFDWVVMLDNQVLVYTMDTKEFKQFVDKFITWDKHSAKPRFGVTSSKMLTWLEERVVA